MFLSFPLWFLGFLVILNDLFVCFRSTQRGVELLFDSGFGKQFYCPMRTHYNITNFTTREELSYLRVLAYLSNGYGSYPLIFTLCTSLTFLTVDETKRKLSEKEIQENLKSER